MKPSVEENESITVLLPCKHQERELFVDAIGSVVRQTSPHWFLLVLTDPASPPEIAEWANSCPDSRVQIEGCPSTGVARALNYGLEKAQTEFICVLLSDDRLHPDAIRILLECRRRHPEADYFYSARRYVDNHGNFVGPPEPVRKLRPGDFTRNGSPVKHLMCWRRLMSFQIGGMDVSLSEQSCAEYDFAWRMAEAGARFQPVAACLYESRLHHAHSWSSTQVSVPSHIKTFRSMFKKHGISCRDTDLFIQRAITRELCEHKARVDHDSGSILNVRCFYETAADAQQSFFEAGIQRRHYFPHRVYVLPKGGPDGLELSQSMTGNKEPSQLREFVLYALPPALDEFPPEIFFDDDLQWHQQQFGLNGQVACASVVLDKGCLHAYTLVSDLVQRISRLPQYRTRIDNQFKGWNRLLRNAVLFHAAENGINRVFVATSELALRHTDPQRRVGPALFRWIYDHGMEDIGALRQGDWWLMDVPKVKSHIAPLTRSFEVDEWPKIVCVMHDIERGLGHTDVNPEFARAANRFALEALEKMLAIEAEVSVQATYNILGILYNELAQRIKTYGHAVAFHSYDHYVPTRPSIALQRVQGRVPLLRKRTFLKPKQLWKCREVDYRVKGYRPPRSLVLPSLSDANLAHYNFEWLASSPGSIRSQRPYMENGIVKIPVHFDDYAMYHAQLSYEDWEAQILKMVECGNFVVLGLHDCYAPFWLNHYHSLLQKLKMRAKMITLDEVAARISLGRARWFEP